MNLTNSQNQHLWSRLVCSETPSGNKLETNTMTIRRNETRRLLETRVIMRRNATIYSKTPSGNKPVCIGIDIRKKFSWQEYTHAQRTSDEISGDARRNKSNKCKLRSLLVTLPQLGQETPCSAFLHLRKLPHLRRLLVLASYVKSAWCRAQSPSVFTKDGGAVICFCHRKNQA